MADYAWPTPDDRKLIGTDVLRVDASVKVSGKAQYWDGAMNWSRSCVVHTNRSSWCT